MPAARFTVLCDECIRIEWSAAGGDAERFVDEPSLFAPRRPLPRRIVIADAALGAPPIDIRTSRFHLQFRPDGKPMSPANLSAQIALPSVTGKRLAFWQPGDQNERNLGGTIETLDGIRGPIPIGEGLLSRDGWRLIDDSQGHLLTGGWVAARSWRNIPKANTDWYLFAYGSDYCAALRALARIAGPVPVPRRAALGSWYSRYWPHTSAEFRGIVADYHQHGFPLDIMVLDMDWHSASTRDQWTGWSWNRTLLPDAEELVSWFHAQSLEVALNLHPAAGIGPDEDRYAAFMREQGADPRTGERLAFDAGNRPYMSALFNEVLAPLEVCERNDVTVVRGVEPSGSSTADPPTRSFAGFRRDNGGGGGVDFWWVDWQQDRFVPSIPGLTNLAWLNRLFFDHTARNGRRGISLSRWAGLGFGDHRHPIHFSGDAHTGWEMLAFQVPLTVAAGNAGCFFWSHDIGGHFGPRIEECTARWVWFGALSAAMRLHSARTAALDRRPWTYPEPFSSAMRSAFALRSSLMPYVDTAAHECESQSLPLLRPMYLAHPDLDRAYRVHAQYTLGGDLLAAPVTSPGIGPRHLAAAPVWFPPTSSWYNWFTHERYGPGSEACIAATIDGVPLFAPAGVPIPTRTFSHRPATEPIDHLVIRLYPGEPGSSHTRQLHEDDGATTSYRDGRLRNTPISAAWSDAGAGRVQLTLIVGPASGTFDGAINERRITLALGGATMLSGITVNGNPAAAESGESDGLFKIRVNAVPVDQRVVIGAVVNSRSADEQSGHDRAVRELRLNTLANPGDRGQQVGPSDSGTIRLAAAWGVGAWPETLAPAGVGRPDSVRVCDPFASINPGTLRAELIERIGPAGFPTARDRILSTHDLDLRVVRAASIPLPPEELAEPPLGLRESRIARLSFTINGEPRTHETIAESRIRPLIGFAAVGPFPWDWRKPIDEQVFDPEFAPAYAAGFAAWTLALRGEKWPVDFRRTFPGAKGLAYAAATLHSPHQQATTLHLDSGDKIEAWLNGAKVFSQDGHDTAEALTSSVRLELPAGNSVLLIKTNDGGGGWGFAATLDGEYEVTMPDRR